MDREKNAWPEGASATTELRRNTTTDVDSMAVIALKLNLDAGWETVPWYQLVWGAQSAL